MSKSQLSYSKVTYVQVILAPQSISSPLSRGRILSYRWYGRKRGSLSSFWLVTGATGVGLLSSTTGRSETTVVGSYLSAHTPKYQHTPKSELTSRRGHNNVMYKKKISSIPRPTYTKLDISSALYALVTVSKRNRNDLQGSQSGTRPNG